ncbi:MAG TPA: DUF1549 domain-containing protein [Pirellulales bacterium]|nr:DUF1549 domain-containing protein [Pirellulales bacterium]
MPKFATVLACWLPLVAASLPAADKVEYVRDVKPLLSRRCYACHGALKRQNSLRLDAPSAIAKGGEQGPAIVAGKSGESLLIQAVVGADDWRMPPEGEPLTADEIATLAAWIDQGAKAPDEPLPADPRDHWSFRPPVRPTVPHMAGGGHPIDALLAVEQQRLGLAPLAPAEKHVLLRRVYLDLIGLPPTRDELRAFLADASPDAYEKVVDRLLASPRHGERWGRHWMDVWRYSDWSGYGMEVRDSMRHIWRWRDWIIESLNSDKPYDRMILEMLAGDELAPADADTLRATGFIARNWYMFNRNVWLDNTVEHTAKAFLGLTLNCARCHDHKFDPIEQRDYYRFRAFFEPHQVRTDRVPGQPDLASDGLPRVYDADAAAPTYIFARGNDAQADKEHPLAPGVPAVLAPTDPEALKIEPVSLPVLGYYPALRPFVQQEMLVAAQAAVDKSRAELAQSQPAVANAHEPVAERKATAAVALATKALATKALATAEARSKSVAARIAADNARYATPRASEAEALAHAAGQAEREAALREAEQNALAAEQALESAKQAVKPDDEKTQQTAAAAETKLAEARKAAEAAAQEYEAALQTASPNYTPLDKVYPATSSGRRLALARWIASPRNPLTARVAVNQIWLRHFGEPLVPTVFDFGLNGKPPANPQLLDWLAVELAERGWSMKAIHKLIVTSDAYRRQSAPSRHDGANLAIDRDNIHLWRFKPRRMEAELVRDSVLAVAGGLDATMGGADIDQNTGETVPRRSVYFRHAHEKFMTFLRLFDSASVNECYRRDESIVPQQALALANSSLAQGQARLLAGKLSAELSFATGEGRVEEASSDAAFIVAAFEQVLCRPPTADERAACEAFLDEQAARLAAPEKLAPFTAGAPGAVKPSADPRRRARENLVHVLLNHNDFVTIR